MNDIVVKDRKIWISDKTDFLVEDDSYTFLHYSVLVS